MDEAAALLGLEALLARKPRQLSGGQRQRVAMGRAIVREPKLFLFDEPLSNLDAKLRVQMRAEIRRLQRRLGVTSLYVTHDQVEAMTLGDRLLVLHQGRPAQLATPDGGVRAPGRHLRRRLHRRAGDELPARASWPRRRAPAACRRPGWSASPTGREAGPDGTRLTIGIRPEHVTWPRRAQTGQTADVDAGRASIWSSRSARRPWSTAGCRGAPHRRWWCGWPAMRRRARQLAAAADGRSTCTCSTGSGRRLPGA